MDANDGWTKQMRKGTAELCVLAILARRESYGYEILQQIRRQPSIALQESTLYLLLGRLLKDGLVSARMRKSGEGPPRRYFELTALGRERLADMSAFWHGFSADVSELIKETPDD
ncbi:PadR family transcriptional regulator [Parasphingopyxis sp.]|uniref:PadR family transcriptional regulator n=1 Tax=Parasphingopyxis sp. TaxID=1920299 RepID=UPI00260871BE|nr:PadR family transcriptional regulator [Parasphingopyxis sp.]